uniref:SnoaL-like domain-containing protein n=1 Tax=Davidia involucrata TaxID=16924 RepID=A0A5B7AM48_DAVIN
MVYNSIPLTMEVPNFYALSLKPRRNRPMFLFNGTVSDIKELSSLPSSFINRFGVLHHLSSPSMKQYNLFMACSFGRKNEIQVLPDQRCFNLQTGKRTLLGRASPSYSFRPCQVKHEDSEGTLSGESILLNEQTLEWELQIAIEEENYAQAAKIRDSLRVLQEDSNASVLAANARFYNSFRNGDLAAMQALWAKGEHVCVVHPGVSGISGYDLVMGSWEFVWADYEFPLQIEMKDVQVHVRGDMGYVTCIELVKTKGSSWGKQFATNVFERIDGQWFICIHHASYVNL